MKKCFKCQQIKLINDFYKHSSMADGHLGKCKECTKADVKKRYYSPEGRKKIIEYEVKRFQTTHRKQKALEYQRRRRIRNPEKDRARNMISNFLRDKKLFKKPCEICGEPVSQAHHHDYSKPTDVMWLCRTHHMMIEGKIPF